MFKMNVNNDSITTTKRNDLSPFLFLHLLAVKSANLET